MMITEIEGSVEELGETESISRTRRQVLETLERKGKETGSSSPGGPVLNNRSSGKKKEKK